MDLMLKSCVISIVIILLIAALVCCLCSCIGRDFFKKNSVSLFAIIFSLVALANCYPRTKELGFDYLGIIIGVLSFLVAILAIMFGYNILDARRQINKELNDAKEKIKELSDSIKDKIIRIESDVENIKKKLDVEKVFVMGNIRIQTPEFKFKDLVAYSTEKNISLMDNVIRGDLIVRDKRDTPNTIYYASGDIISEVEGEDEDIGMPDNRE